MADSDQETAEALDDDKLAEEYPPDRPLAVDDQGTTGIEQLAGETVTDREERTEPEVWERETASPAESGPVLEEELEPGEVDDEKDLVAPPPAGDDHGPLDVDDDFAGDETTRDVATERSPRPAEETAVRVDDEPPGTTG